MLRLTCLLVLVCVSCGCASLNLKSPTATINGMTVKSVDASGFTMDFDVELQNPNATAIPLSTAEYKLGLAGVNVVEGKARPEGSIPANGTTHVSLPVTLTYENLLAAEKAIVKTGGDIPYALDAGLMLNTGMPLLGDMRIPLQYKGTLALRQILNNPQALLQSTAAQKLARQLIGRIFSQ